jgi:hypothetical protein
MDPFRNGAAGVVISAKLLRPKDSRRADHPVCGPSVASQLFIDAAATPPFQGGECAEFKIHRFVHTFIAAPAGRSAYGNTAKHLFELNR